MENTEKDLDVILSLQDKIEQGLKRIAIVCIIWSIIPLPIMFFIPIKFLTPFTILIWIWILIGIAISPKIIMKWWIIKSIKSKR